MKRLDFLLPFVAFLAALLGVVGAPKWNPEGIGLGKVTGLGWLVLALALTALALSTAVTARNRLDEQRRKQKDERATKVGKQAVHEAVQYMVYPFWDSPLWGKTMGPVESPLQMLDLGRRQELAALNLNSVSPYKDGTFCDIKWFSVIESAAIEGKARLERCLQTYQSRLPIELIEAIAQLLGTEFLQMRLARMHDLINANTHGDPERTVPFFIVAPEPRHDQAYQAFWELVALILMLTGEVGDVAERAKFQRRKRQ